MVKRRRWWLAAAVVLVAGGCTLLTTTPFPAYVGGVESVIDISSAVNDVLAGQPRARYDLTVLKIPTGEKRLLLLVTPILDEEDEDDGPDPVLLVYDADGNSINSVPEPNPIEYLSRPILIGFDGNVLIGVVIRDPSTWEEAHSSLAPHGLTGYGFVQGSDTILISQPGGETYSFSLKVRVYSGASWVPQPSTVIADTIRIVSSSDEDSQTTAAAAASVDAGYRLHGLRKSSDATPAVELLLSHPLSGRLYVTKILVSDILATTKPDPIEDIYVDRAEVEMKDAFVYFSDDWVFLRREVGYFERYAWTGSFQDRIVSERGTGRVYAFDPDADKMYRFDPQAGTLAVLKPWW